MLNKEKEENGMIHIHHSSHDSYRTRELGIFENGLLDSDVFLQVSYFFSHIFQNMISVHVPKTIYGRRTFCYPEMCLNHSLIHFSFVIIFLPKHSALGILQRSYQQFDATNNSIL